MEFLLKFDLARKTELADLAEAKNPECGPRKHAAARVGTTFAQIQPSRIHLASKIPFDITWIRFSIGFEATWIRIYWFRSHLDSNLLGFDFTWMFDITWIRLSTDSK